MARVTYIGLNMDATMVPKIVAALRGLYPNIVQPTDSDNRVVQLVLHQFITEHLAEWARRTATPSLDVVVQQAQDGALATQAAAADQAMAAAADIQPTATT